MHKLSGTQEVSLMPHRKGPVARAIAIGSQVPFCAFTSLFLWSLKKKAKTS